MSSPAKFNNLGTAYDVQVINPPVPPPNTKVFRDFAIGDVLVAPNSGAIGIKTSINAIRWATSGNNPVFASANDYADNRTCDIVAATTVYRIPAKVQFVVTL